MQRILRFLAVVLLALILPAQGMAGVVAGQCMALGHHQPESPAPVDSMHAHGGADGHDHATHSHADDTVAGEADDGASHCGPCTACCASASIIAASPLPFFSSSASSQYLFAQSPPPGVQPDALDRPPLPL